MIEEKSSLLWVVVELDINKRCCIIYEKNKGYCDFDIS